MAYACLNDWDGLILYNHHTSENWDDQPADEIRNVFDAYNDPPVTCQWGFAATVFQKGLIAPAKHQVDVVYTKNDLDTLPNFHAMPDCFFPYITRLRNVFLDQGEHYTGNADLAVNAGFTNTADLRGAKHAVYYAWSPYRDAFHKYREGNRLTAAANGPNALVFEDIASVAGIGDYRQFAGRVDRAMKDWGILDEGTGLVDGKLVSDTGEICFDPEHSRFQVRNESCGYFSGAPTESIALSDTISVHAKNERISLSLLPVSENEYLLTAMGTTGMDETTMSPGPEFMPGLALTVVHFAGKLYAETLEGSISVKAVRAALEILSPVGEVLERMEQTAESGVVTFELNGNVPGVQYRLTVG